MVSETKRILRCAIYTRKSSEEGLEQSFNSLDAQREACLAYIQSQKHEGWKAVSAHYDDGGYSGGNLQRPALTKLLDDISAGKVDLVVVYKVDRLTRSLSDFAKIVEAFDAKGASFVSVTQAFNTSTSMGRLTLNVLLSFAQFEREVTGERIRDKIAASKKKGMWMGGIVPLGYDIKDRKLVVNAVESKIVQGIFTRYLQLGCVRALKLELDRVGVHSKLRVRADGKSYGGGPLYRGALYKILRNPIYAGEVRHRTQTYQGEHEAIVAREIWDEVQQLLSSNAQHRMVGVGTKNPSLLTGLLKDEHGHPMTPSHTKRRNRQYRYYAATPPSRSREGSAPGLLRIPAHDVEAAFWDRLKAFLTCPAELLSALEGCDGRQAQVIQAGHESVLIYEQAAPSMRRGWVQGVVEEVRVSPTRLTIRLAVSGLATRLGLPPQAISCASPRISLSSDCRLKRGGRGLRFIIPSQTGERGEVHLDQPLIKAIARGRIWFDQLVTAQVPTREKIAQANGVSAQYVATLLPLAWLAPDIVEAILQGRQPKGLSVERLRKGFPVEWTEQRRVLGFEPVGG